MQSARAAMYRILPSKASLATGMHAALQPKHRAVEELRISTYQRHDCGTGADTCWGAISCMVDVSGAAESQ